MKKSLFLLLLLVPIIYATIGSIEIDEFTNGLTTENITFVTENITRFIQIPRAAYLDTVNFELRGGDFCYQEYVNISTACGGLDTGVYDAFSGATWDPGQFPDKTRDGNFSTYASPSGSGSWHYYFNYTVPSDAIDAIWRIKDGVSEQNRTLSHCFSAIDATPTLQLKVWTDNGATSTWQCHNRTSGLWLFVASNNPANLIYEEAVWWVYSDGNITDAYIELGGIDSTREYEYSGQMIGDQRAILSMDALGNISRDCNCLNCSISGSDCNVPFTFSSSSNGTLSILDINITYEFGLDNCTNLSMEALNISFVELDSGDGIDVNYANTVEFWLGDDDDNSFNFSVAEPSTNFTQLCIYPNWSTIQGDMTIQYINSTSFYEYSTYNTTFDNETDVLTLYVQGGTSQVVLTVEDLNGDAVAGAFVKVLKYDVGTGAYSVTEILETDGNGQTIANIVLIDAFYRFIIEYQGIVRLIEPSSGGIRVLSTTKTFRINLEGADWVDLLDTTFGVQTSLIFNEVTDSFVYTWNDPNSAMHQGCLSVVKRNRTGTTTIGDQCVTSAASSIVIPITAVQNDSSFHATGYLLFDELMITDQLSKIFDALFHFDFVGNKQDTLMVGFILITGLALVGIPFPAVSFILMGVGLFGAMALGIYDIGVGLVVAIIILFIIQIVKMRSG